MAHVVRKGSTASGIGVASSAFAGARDELAAYFGQPPQAGTFNVLLRWPLLLRPAAAIPFPGSLAMNQHGAWPVRLLGHPGLLVRWAWCPLHVAEIVSPVAFRTTYGLADGAQVSVEIDEDIVFSLPRRSLVAWMAMWAFNRKGYLDQDYVKTLMEQNPRAVRLAGQPVMLADRTSRGAL